MLRGFLALHQREQGHNGWFDTHAKLANDEMFAAEAGFPKNTSQLSSAFRSTSPSFCFLFLFGFTLSPFLCVHRASCVLSTCVYKQNRGPRIRSVLHRATSRSQWVKGRLICSLLWLCNDYHTKLLSQDSCYTPIVYLITHCIFK